MNLRVTYIPLGKATIVEQTLTLPADPNGGITPYTVSEIWEGIGSCRIIEITETDSLGFPLRSKMPGVRPELH